MKKKQDRTMSKALARELKKMLLGVLAEAKSPEEIELLLAGVLTEKEMEGAVRRLGIAMYLDKGRKYEDIKANLGVSSATIAGVAEEMGNSGWQEIIRRIKAELWAEDWTQKIVGGFKKVMG